MTARVIDGRAVAAEVRAEVAERVARLVSAGITPGFVDVLIGDESASATYVRMKNRAATKVGMVALDRTLPADASAEQALSTIRELNEDPAVHGVIVQSPLPHQSPIDIFDLQSAIAPEKDVDGLHPTNQGLLAMGRPRFVPATPAGVVELLHREGVDIEGSRVVVVGRSTLVGRPLSMLLSLKEPGLDATVTLCHTGTRDLAVETLRGDILVVAAGRAGGITAEMVRPGAVVIDVGTNRAADGTLLGDVDFETVSRVASAITPVPGGVGPMTVAMLLANTVTAAERSTGRSPREGSEGMLG